MLVFFEDVVGVGVGTLKRCGCPIRRRLKICTCEIRERASSEGEMLLAIIFHVLHPQAF